SPSNRVITAVEVESHRRERQDEVFFLRGRVRAVDRVHDTLLVEKRREVLTIRRKRLGRVTIAEVVRVPSTEMVRVPITDATEIRVGDQPGTIEEIQPGERIRLKAEGNKIAAFVV